MGRDVFGEAFDQAHIWVGEVAEEFGGDRDKGYRALRATLHAIRDRLAVVPAAHLSAQLPLVVRGIFFEGWDPSRVPVKMHADEFLERVRHEAVLESADEAEAAVRAVVGVMWEHLSPGALQNVGAQFPVDLQELIY